MRSIAYLGNYVPFDPFGELQHLKQRKKSEINTTYSVCISRNNNKKRSTFEVIPMRFRVSRRTF